MIKQKYEKNKIKNNTLSKALRFYFITDYDVVNNISIQDQVRIAIEAGVTTIQYRNKKFTLDQYNEATKIRDLCYENNVLFIVNDNILLAKAINADGVHLGQDDESLILARKVLGSNSILGLSISTLKELNESNIADCDYIGVGPVFSTKTKIDAKLPHGAYTLSKIAQKVLVPVVAIGGINTTNAKTCIDCGADGIAVISSVSRSKYPIKSATQLADICFDNF